MDERSLAQSARPDDTIEAHYASLERLEAPHACDGSGIVWIGRMVADPETGEEVEVIEAVPCKRCANSR